MFQRNDVYAHMWFNIAPSHLNDNALKVRGVIAEEMTSSHLETAENLAPNASVRNTKIAE